jgi:predicted enzyme related to lactoylglutathione lyase
MLTITSTFSGFSVNNLSIAKNFYATVLGLTVEDEVGGSRIFLPAGNTVWMYEKADHQPATYTMLNFVVPHIEAAVTELTSRGIKFIHYSTSYQDDQGIMRGKDHNMGPNIAWFTDPAGNILSIIEQ